MRCICENFVILEIVWSYSFNSCKMCVSGGICIVHIILRIYLCVIGIQPSFRVCSLEVGRVCIWCENTLGCIARFALTLVCVVAAGQLMVIQ